MIVALFLAAAAPQTALDAERAFAADARRFGQWTAFRKWASDHAVMFVPQPVNAQSFLKDRRDPPKAVEWWPTTSYVSCDGSMAVNTGGWKRPDGSIGYFTTVWKRQKNGAWKWALDHGDTLNRRRSHPAEPTVVRASCKGPATRLSQLLITDGNTSEPKTGEIYSSDRSLGVTWSVQFDNNRTIEVRMAQWTKPGHFKRGVYWMTVATDEVSAPE